MDDSLGQGKAKAPSTLLGGEARHEDCVEMVLGDALSCVGYFQRIAVWLLFGRKGDGAFAVHGVDGILAEILHHPFEQGGTHVYDERLLGKAASH